MYSPHCWRILITNRNSIVLIASHYQRVVPQTFNEPKKERREKRRRLTRVALPHSLIRYLDSCGERAFLLLCVLTKEAQTYGIEFRGCSRKNAWVFAEEKLHPVSVKVVGLYGFVCVCTLLSCFVEWKNARVEKVTQQLGTELTDGDRPWLWKAISQANLLPRQGSLPFAFIPASIIALGLTLTLRDIHEAGTGAE